MGDYTHMSQWSCHLVLALGLLLIGFAHGLDLAQLTNQVKQLELRHEELVRSMGQSGITGLRINTGATKPYYLNTATGSRVQSIHDHANNERVLGMAEVHAVLNGVEFFTRHNDFPLLKPGNDIGEANDTKLMPYNTLEPIEFPEVPPAVLAKSTTEEQIIEMQKWFKAFKDQDTSVRDYRPYFKAALCYLEGAWTVPPSDGSVDEPFDSERHRIEAETYHELLSNVRFASESGRKDSEENYAFLPTKIVTGEGGNTFLAQWNYRIACHPLSMDVPTGVLCPIDDLTTRVAHGNTMEEHLASRSGRFRVSPKGQNCNREGTFSRELLDQAMEEIPGKNGYGAFLEDRGVDNKAARNATTRGLLNAANYHHDFLLNKDASQTNTRQRSHSDPAIYMALTTQTNIAPSVTVRTKNNKETKVIQRWTYAIPLEIVYLTPLNKWNPYNIPYRGKHSGVKEVILGANNQRDGLTPATAFDGTSSRYFFQTPAGFFSTISTDGLTGADTGVTKVWVLDSTGTAHLVAASGMRIFTVGGIRLRYPIGPFSYEGSPTWKRSLALTDYMENGCACAAAASAQFVEPDTIDLLLNTSRKNAIPHEHTIPVLKSELKGLINGTYKTLTVKTTEDMDHSHEIDLIYEYNDNNKMKITYAENTFDLHKKIVKPLSMSMAKLNATLGIKQNK